MENIYWLDIWVKFRSKIMFYIDGFRGKMLVYRQSEILQHFKIIIHSSHLTKAYTLCEHGF